jgi:hypothetical protein
MKKAISAGGLWTRTYPKSTGQLLPSVPKSSEVIALRDASPHTSVKQAL